MRYRITTVGNGKTVTHVYEAEELRRFDFLALARSMDSVLIEVME